MTKIPDVPMDVWSNLYEAARRFRSAAAWEFMHDGQLFAVRDGSGETGYACVLGGAGEMFALCVYRGAKGFDAHRRMQAGELTADSDDILTVQDCLMASFEDRGMLEKADLQAVKKLGLKFQGAQGWPMFRSHLPGYLPWMLTAQEAVFLTEALLCACEVVGKVEAGELDLEAKPGHVLTHVLKDDMAFESGWEPHPVYRPEPLPPPALDAERVARARAAAVRRGGTWEAAAFFTPTPIGDRDRPYFLRMGMAVDQGSLFIFPPQMGGPEDKPDQLLAEALLSAAESVGALPGEVWVDKRETADALAPLGRALGLGIVVKKKLKALPVVRRDIEKAMASRMR